VTVLPESVFVDGLREDAEPFMATLYGVKYYTIHAGKLYFLGYNEKTEARELFEEEIK